VSVAGAWCRLTKCCKNIENGRLRRMRIDMEAQRNPAYRFRCPFVMRRLISGLRSCQICNMASKTNLRTPAKPLSTLQANPRWIRFELRNAGCPADRVSPAGDPGVGSKLDGATISRGNGTDFARSSKCRSGRKARRGAEARKNLPLKHGLEVRT
jgi:hypothetical protein